MALDHHKDLTGADLHEPKGAASASAGQVYVADGLGSGTWTTSASKQVPVTRTLSDISTAGDVYVVAPVDGVINNIFGVLEAAISGSDSAVTFYINGVLITAGGMTVLESGSAAGDEYQSTPSATNTVVAGDVLKISTDGASTNTAPFTVVLLIDES